MIDRPPLPREMPGTAVAAARPELETDPDVLVAGGGLVGLTLALMLGSSGLRVVVVEAAPVAGPHAGYADRAIALSFASACLLAAAAGDSGAWERLHGRATEIRRVHVSEQGRFGVTRIDADRLGLPALGYVATARAIEGALADALAGEARARLIAPARVDRLQVRSGGATAWIETESGTHELHPRLVVAADGGQSLVRRLIGLPARGHDYRQRALVTEVTASQPHRGTAFERFTPRGPLALLPLGQRRLGIIWAADGPTVERLLTAPEREFLDQLGRTFGARLGRFVRVGHRGSFPLHMAASSELRHARVVLAGNAANHLHPVAGQGFNLGLRDAAALAATLAQARRDDEDIAAPAVLARYAARRAADHCATVRFTDGLVNLFSNDLAPLGSLRGAARVAYDLLPALNRALARRAMGLDQAARAGRGLGG